MENLEICWTAVANLEYQAVCGPHAKATGGSWEIRGEEEL